MSQEVKYLTKKYLVKNIKEYNRALLFNRSKAKELREKANEILNAFADDEIDLYNDDLSDYMDAYIKTFGVMKKRCASDVAKRCFYKLNRDSYATRYDFINHQRGGKFLAFESKIIRGLSSFFRRYDLTKSELQQLYSPGERVPQSLAKSGNNNQTAEASLENLFPSGPEEQLPHTDSLCPSRDSEYQYLLSQQTTKTPKNKRKQKNPTRWLRFKKTFIACGLTVLGGFGYFQFVRADNAEAREESNYLEKSIRMKAQQKVNDTIESDTIRFDAPIFPSVISGQTNVAKANSSTKAEAKTVSHEKTQAVSKSVTSSAQSKEVKVDSRDTSDHLAKIYKNYYDNTIALHLGEKGKNQLYAELNKAIHQGKITLPKGETMEHLALVMTVSNLVQPYSQDNKLLQKITTDEALTVGQQQAIWQIVKKAGEKSGNIKGTGSHSNYNNSSPQVQKKHNDALQALKNAGRLYNINHYTK